MSKTQKELAFLRDLNITNDWIQRFTDIVDAQLKLPKEGRFLYVNIGTGSHALILREKMKPEVEFSGISENKETLKIADAKAKVIKADVDFQTSADFSKKNFETVLADAMMVKPQDLDDFLKKIVDSTASKGDVTFFLPTAGSFGEIFSLLWEVLFNADLAQRGAEVERLISEIPTVFEVEEMAQRAGLKKIETTTKNEIFEYDTGEEFVSSPIVADFLLPIWLDFLSEKEKRQVTKKLAQIIDSERDGLTFRFSVKATLVSGEKS
jgi:hypothetical protein